MDRYELNRSKWNVGDKIQVISILPFLRIPYSKLEGNIWQNAIYAGDDVDAHGIRYPTAWLESKGGSPIRFELARKIITDEYPQEDKS